MLKTKVTDGVSEEIFFSILYRQAKGILLNIIAFTKVVEGFLNNFLNRIKSKSIYGIVKCI